MRQRGFAGGLPSTGRPPRTNSLSGILARNPSFQQKISDGETTVKNTGLYQKVYSTPKKEEKIDSNLVCVYVGSKTTPFSEYGMSDIIRGTMRYWNVEPERDLSKLFEKKLLVLPCPIRVLTEREVTTIKNFLKGNRRIAFFAGSNLTIANAILTQLESRFFIVAESTPGVRVLAGYITPKELTIWPAYTLGRVSVYKTYWNTAIVKDWNGFGMLYNDVVAIAPYNIIAWLGPNTQSFLDWIGLYTHSTDLLTKVNAYNPPPGGTDPVWTVTDPPSPTFPTGYLDGMGYGSLNLTAWGAWMSANIGNLPLSYIHAYGYNRTRTTFTWGTYNLSYYNYTDKKYRGYIAAYTAYVPAEKIIVSSFKPYWLQYNYDAIFSGSGIAGPKEFSSWFLNGDLEYYDLFEQGGFQDWSASFMYWSRGGEDGGGFYFIGG